MSVKTTIFLIYTCCVMSSVLLASDAIDLSGDWRFAMDASDVGLQQQWYKVALPGSDTLQLPCSMQAQGFGNDPGPSTPWVGDIRESEWNKPKYAPYRSADNFKMPFWLQPDKYYKGAAWYQKTVTIPSVWKNKHITLTLERPHWETRVWVDASEAGSANYLSVPHTYDLSELMTPGEHTLTIRVDNRMIVNVGPDWFAPKRLGLVFEAKIGSGSLLVCSVNLLDNLQERPATRQLKHSLLAYMASDAFKPQTEVDLVLIQSLFRELSPMQKLGATVIGTDSFEPGDDGSKAIDSDSLTMWHTQWSAGQPAMKFTLIWVNRFT